MLSFEAHSEVEVLMRRAILEVESLPFHHTRAPGNYQSSPHLKTSLTHQWLRLIVISCPLVWAKLSSIVDNNGMSLMPSSHQWWTVEMNNVPRLRAEEVIYRKQLLDAWYKTMLWAEQKSMILLLDKICRLTKPENQILDACCATIAIFEYAWSCNSFISLWDVRGIRIAWLRQRRC